MESQVDELTLRTIFDSMDIANLGKIRAEDLQNGLSNGTDNPFDIKVCRLMVAMYDKDNSGTIDFNEFSQLYQFVTSWVNAFKSADTDEDLQIDQYELNRLLNNLGYRLSQEFYTFIGRKFNLDREENLKFDTFLYICILLHILTGIYSSMDYKMESQIKLNFDQFLCVYFDVTSTFKS